MLMSADNPTFFSYSNDGRVTHVDPTTVPVDQLQRHVDMLAHASESGFRIIGQAGRDVVFIDSEELASDPTDPEADALFLEHLIMDELCSSLDYLTIERTDVVPQEMIPESEA